MVLRELKKEEIELIRMIDRREIIDEIYYFRDNRLLLEKEHYDVKSFPEDELEDIVIRLNNDFDNGGIVVGAFKDEKIVGMTSLQNYFRGTNKDSLKMDILYVSSSYRKLGVGRRLVDFIKVKAKSLGAKKLYISATSSKNTVDFYISQGCRLAEEIDEELFRKEPLDIHLELLLYGGNDCNGAAGVRGLEV